ncbi:large ribosomal subunit protein uL4m [Petromyzon marinus]|uniref:large ribosomal subunit protein uL4m n=1 Tax=Petromyzon marinus TaxID=7757 RepID=UPI003F71F6E6
MLLSATLEADDGALDLGPSCCWSGDREVMLGLLAGQLRGAAPRLLLAGVGPKLPAVVSHASQCHAANPESVVWPCETAAPVYAPMRQAWLESLRGLDVDQLGLVDLHPDVFGVPPRLDILHQVLIWQKNFKRISYAKTKTRAEMRGGGRKPWNQKGSGRARHGSIRSPLWKGGGVAHGPRGPISYYYMLPMKVRVKGLTVALSVKHAQDDLHIVDSLDIPTADPQYLLDLAQYRQWGDSVLIVDVNEQMPKNILEATEKLKTITVMPALGLNVYSMLKYHTLVLTVDTVRFLERKLLWHKDRYGPLYPMKLPYTGMP